MGDVSEGERRYVAEGIALGVRTDGRSRTDCRPAEFELNVVAQAHGSARLHLGATDVLVGVKVELGNPDHATPSCGSLKVSVECSSCASPEFKGRGGEEWGIELGKALEASVVGKPGSGTGLDPTTLCVVPGKACWVVYVDALVLNEGGNVLGALSLAVRAALAATRIPKVEVTMGGEDDEPEIEISNDADSLPLAVANVPVILSISQVGTRCVVDLTSQEEPCAAATLHIGVTKDGRLAGYTKDGTGGLDPSLMQEMLELAQKLGPSIIKSLDTYLEQAEKATLFSG